MAQRTSAKFGCDRGNNREGIHILARCYLVEGTANYQIGGEAEQISPVGQHSMNRPASTIIANFGNASDLEPMIFVAFYLLNAEHADSDTLLVAGANL